MMAMLLLTLAPLVTHAHAATPPASATPAATPLVFGSCDDLGPYFAAVAGLANGNAGYVAVRTHPDGVFQVDSAEADARIAALDGLVASLAAIAPPVEAAAWHAAFSDIVAWYRDLAASPDMASYQRTVNRDKTLIPALSRATIAGQAACGADVWQEAYDAAFGGR
jgi:hypothetical protein